MVPATHLVVSAGGNDALGFAYLLAAPAGSVAETLQLFGSAQDRFASDYEAMAEAPATTTGTMPTPSSRPRREGPISPVQSRPWWVLGRRSRVR